MLSKPATNLEEKKSPMSKADETWIAESLRLTVFSIPGTVLGESAWWNSLLNEPSEINTTRPQYQDEGPFENGRLTLTVKANRVDWTYTPDLRKLEEGLPSIGPFAEALDKFSGLMRRWLENSPPIKRLAFGAVLLQSAQDRITGYDAISKYLPAIKLDGRTSSDFVYQINRPRDSRIGIQGLKVNRVSKWSVMRMQRLQVEIQSGESQATPMVIPHEKNSACRLELDINTSPEFSGDIPKQYLVSLFEELVSLGREIASKGDIP